MTINSDLVRLVKRMGINASQVAEEALAREVHRRETERLKAEIGQDLQACNAYVARHGSFAEMVREHLGRGGDDGADE
jgi:post-segregation antitoxin (ccd killing protein)